MTEIMIPGFDPEIVADVVERMKDNPALGRKSIMKLYGLSESRAKRFAREVKIKLGVDPTWKASHHKGNDGELDKTTVVHATPAQSTKGTPDLSIEESPEVMVAEGLISCRFAKADTLAELHRLSEADLDKWEPYKHRINRWGSADNPSWQVRCEYRLREVKVDDLLLEAGIESLREASADIEPLPYEHPISDIAYEITCVDPHLGGMFFQPGVDAAWSLDHCRALWFYGFQEAIRRCRKFGEPGEIMVPVGNDFLHAEGMVRHTTTGGTDQPEMVSWTYAAKYGARMLIDTVLWLRQEFPKTRIVIPVIQGNHSRATDFMLGMVLEARFWHDPGVVVNAENEPYKAWRWGCNLVGLEHGHSVGVIRLASLMAQEWPDLWLLTNGGYREWHRGDQHRKGTGGIITYEEQGVAVEGLAGLTPGNEWHKLKSFNNQQRAAATAFVWDKHAGPVARFPVQINSKTNLPMGDATLEAPDGMMTAPDLL